MNLSLEELHERMRKLEEHIGAVTYEHIREISDAIRRACPEVWSDPDYLDAALRCGRIRSRGPDLILRPGKRACDKCKTNAAQVFFGGGKKFCGPCNDSLAENYDNNN